MEEKRIAVLSVIVTDLTAAERLNAYLSEYGAYVVGRMGIPYREKGVSVLCVVLDAPAAVVNATLFIIRFLFSIMLLLSLDYFPTGKYISAQTAPLKRT